MSGSVAASIPSAPLVDSTGNVTPAWRAFFSTLQVRTGGTTGQSTAELSASLAQETTARTNADAALNTAVNNEAVARENADALLVPIANLGTQFAATSLSGLPTTNPGGGLPWLSAGNVHVGP